jgi:hypothetical protein
MRRESEGGAGGDNAIAPPKGEKVGLPDVARAPEQQPNGGGNFSLIAEVGAGGNDAK